MLLNPYIVYFLIGIAIYTTAAIYNRESFKDASKSSIARGLLGIPLWLPLIIGVVAILIALNWKTPINLLIKKLKGKK